MPQSFTLRLQRTLKRSLKRRFKQAVVGLQVGTLLFSPFSQAMADGLTGGVVVDGAATISAAGSVTTINQASQNAVINWNTFNVGAGETANFVQPNINASVLNRVTGGDFSTIAGQINANGNVILVNPQGIIFSNGSTVNVGSLTATTLNIGNEQFMNNGQLNFAGPSNASVINNGSITANNGNINFFAADVQNNGTLNAPNGLINLGAGHDVTLHENGTYTINGANGSVQVLNTGAINGGTASLTAGAGVSAVNAGVAKATMIVRQNGRIRLGNAESVIEMAGGSTISASGGSHSVVNMTGPTAEVVDASIQANGPGGEINVLTSDVSTVMDSTLNADNVEVSSQGTVVVDNVASSGALYVDPVDVTLGVTTAASITVDTVNGGAGGTTAPGDGDITVTGDLTAFAGDITLLANNDIIVETGNGVAIVNATGDITFIADADLSAIPGGTGSDGAGVVSIDGVDIIAGGTFTAYGDGDVDSPVGVSIVGGMVRATAIDIDGYGGGLTAADLRGIVAGAADADDALLTIGPMLTSGNIGVVLDGTDLKTSTGDLNIDGWGGMGLDLNSGIDIFDTPINTEAGNINIVGVGGGLDAEFSRGGSSWILEDPGNDTVDTLFELGWDEDALATLELLPSGLNFGVTITGSRVSVTSDYVEPANIRDINNYYITGEYPEGGGFEYDFAVGRDDLDAAGARHPDARHILIRGTGGIGSFVNTGVDIFSIAAVDIRSESADIHIDGTGGGIPDSHLRGLIETTKDLTPFMGSDRVANVGPVSNGALITAIGTLLGDGNTGTSIGAGTAVDILANANTPIISTVGMADGVTRTVKEVGGNIFIDGQGGTGKSANLGIELYPGTALTILSEIGNIDIEGIGGGPSENVFVMDPGNDRVDTLLEVDFTATDLDDFIAEIWTPAVDNHGVEIFAGTSIAITSNFEEPPALRRFQDGTFGYGYLEPEATYGTDDAAEIGDLVLVDGLPHDKDGVGLYLLPDENGNLIGVDNQVDIKINDYATAELGDTNDGFDVEGPNTLFGIPVVHQRRVDIVGTGGNGVDNNDGINFVSTTGQAVTSLAADINMVGTGGGIPDALTKSIIENAQDIHPYNGSDRIDDVSLTGEVITGTDLIVDIGDLYGDDNDGIYMTDPLDVTVRTTLTPTMIWDGANGLSTTPDHARPLGTDGSELVRLLTPGGFVDTALSDLKDADLTAFGDGVDSPADGPSGTIPDAQELFAQKQRIAKAADNIIVTSRVSRADINIIGTGGKGQAENDGIEMVSGLVVNIEALSALTGSDAGNITVRGTGGGIPAGGVGFGQNNPSGNVIATDHVMSRLAGGDVTGNNVTDNLLEAELVEGDMAALATTVFGDDNHGVHIVSGTATNITSAFDEPFVAPGRWVYMDWFTDQNAELVTTNGLFAEANGNDLKMFVNTESDEDFGVPIVAWRTVEITGRGGTGIGSNIGLDIDAGTAVNIITDSANIDLNGFGGGMPDAVIHSMVENATELVTHLNDIDDINDRIRGGDLTGDRMDDTYISNTDLLTGIAAAYGDMNKGIEITATTSNTVQSTATRLEAWNSHSGNIEITGYGGPGASLNKGIEFNATLSNTVQTGVGNIDIDGLGGGIAAGNLVSGFDNPLFGDVISIDPASDLLVDQILERDLDDADLGLFGGFAAGLADNKGVEFIAVTSNTIQSDFAEPINLRDLQGQYLTGEYFESPGDDSGLFLPDAAGGSVVHPLARFVTILGAGGHGADTNEGVKFDSVTSTTIQSNSADIIIDGFGGGVPNRVIHSLVENAKDTQFNVPGGTTDRTDAMGNIGHADVPVGGMGNVVNGVEVAAENATLIATLEQLYGDGNKGIFANTVTTFDVLANASTADGNNFNYASRTQKEVGGNITMFGRGGTGQSDNMGIHTNSVTATNIIAGLGNIRIDGAGGGMPSGDPNLATTSYPDVVFGDVPNSSSDAEHFGAYSQHVGPYRPNNRLAVALPQLENDKDGTQVLPIQDTSVELIAQTYTGLVGDLAKPESDLSGNVFGIQHSGNFRTDRVLEADFAGADIDALVDTLWAPTANNTGVKMDAVTAVNIESTFKEPPALRRFIVDVDESGEIDAGDFDMNGDPIRVTYGFGYFEPDNIRTGINTSLATNKGDLVLVDANLQGNYLIADKYGSLIPVANQTGFAVNDNGVNVINLPAGSVETMTGTYAVNGDTSQAIVLSNGGVNAGDQGLTNGADGSYVVDGPGLGYQDGIPVVQQRAVNIVGVGGYGNNSNMGNDINTVTAINITTDAADLVIDGLGGGISSLLTNSIVENVADVHPWTTSGGGFTDRIDDFAADAGAELGAFAVPANLTRSDVDVQEMDTTDLIAAIGRLYGDNNDGINTSSVTSTTIETNLTATTIWDGSTKVGADLTLPEPVGTADVLQDLGPTGNEMIELPASLGGGMVSIDTLKDIVVDNQTVGSEDIQKVKHDAAKAGDNIITTSRISRADLAIYGEGGRGKGLNKGIDMDSVLSINVEAKSSVEGDAGNLTIYGVGGGIPSGGFLSVGTNNPDTGSVIGIGLGQSVAARNVIATDHTISSLLAGNATGNGITDTLLEADFAGTDLEDLANMVYGDDNIGVEMTALLPINIKSEFEEPFVAPGRWKYIDWFMDQSTEQEYVPNGNDLKMFVNVEEEGSDVPIIGYRNLQIVGKGGTGKGGNKGIFLDSLLATNIESVSANIKLDGQGGGIPDQVTHSMIENATDLISHLDVTGDVNDRINDRRPINNRDLIKGIEAIYGDDNMGIHTNNVTALNIKSTDDTLASWNAYVGNIDIDGIGGPGSSTNHGTHMTTVTAITIESGVGNIDIQGIGGGLPAGDLVGTRSQGGIDNPLFDDVITIGNNDLFDRLLERDFANLHLVEFTNNSDLFGDDNRGVSFESVTATNIDSLYVENASVRDIHNVVLTGDYAVGTTGMFGADAAGGPYRHPLARELNVKGFGGSGVDDNRGIFYNTVTSANITSESADITQAGYGGGVPEYVFNSMIINSKDTTPPTTINLTDGINNIGSSTEPLLVDIGGNGQVQAAGNLELIASIGRLLGANNKGIQSTNVTSFNTLANANTPDMKNFVYETRTKKEVGGNIRMLGYGGIGQDDNTGIHLSTVTSVNIEAGYGNIDIDGIGGGVPGGPNLAVADAVPNRGIFSINGNGLIDGLLEADLSDTDVNTLNTFVYSTANDNDGFRTNTVTSTNIKSDFKEPPALRQYADGTYGYGYFNPNDATDRGVLAMVGAEGDGRYLVVDKYGALLPVANRPAFTLNDNGNDAGDIRTPGVAVVQERSVDVTGIGGTGVADNQGVNLNAVTSINLETLAATINLEGIGGGMESAVIRSLVENGADTTPAVGRDRTDDLSGIQGAVASAITDPMATSTIIDAYEDFYGADNDGIFLSSVTATNIKTTLTPELVWDGSTKITDGAIFPGSAADVLQPLGTDGSEMVMGMRADMLPGATRAEYARETDNLIVTANRSRADINILGLGGRGDSDNRGVQINAVTAINIQALNNADSLQDGGNITINAIGGGIPSGTQFGPRAIAGGINTPFATQSFAPGGLSATQLSGTGTGGDVYNGRDANFILGNVCLRTITSHNNVVDNVLNGDGNGITDTLLEVGLNTPDLPRIAADVYGSDNDGWFSNSVTATTIESAFTEPFVPVLPDGSPVHLNGNGPLVASRNIIVNGQGGTGVDDNKGIDMNAVAALDIKSVSANIRLDGIAGGAPQILGYATADQVGMNMGLIPNSVIIGAVNDLHGDDNKGVELRGVAGTTVESTDTRVSAPNSLVGGIAIIGQGGPGTNDNIGVDLLSPAAVTVRSGVGNIAIVGDGGGFPTEIVLGAFDGIDGYNELPFLLPSDVALIADGYGDNNHGVHTMAPAVTIESLYEEPNLGDPGIGAAHAYSFRNGANKANPFFLNSTMPVSKASPRTDASEGFVRVNRLDIREILAGQNGAGSNGLVEGREIVIAGRGGTGQNANKGVFMEGAPLAEVKSIDADVDIDGYGGGIPDVVIAALDAAHPGFEMPIANLYGSENHGVEFVAAGSGVKISDEGDIEVNGTGGQGYADNKGILIDGPQVWEAEEGDIIMVGTGGGILETFNIDYDFVGGMGLRENNHGIEINGAAVVESKFDAQTSDDPYEMKMDALLALDGQVGNNAGLGNTQVGQIRDINSMFYEHDLGGPITDDVGVLIDGASMVKSADADIDLYANLDLLVRGASMVTTSEDGDIAAVATRHLEVSGASLVNSSGTKANGDPTQTTVAWDQSPDFEGDHVYDTLGRLKIDAASGIGASMGAGELRLYGNRRGPDPQPFGTNAILPHPTNYALGTPAYSNEIDAGATFNGTVWTDVENQPTTDAFGNLIGNSAVDSGDHNLEFCTWEQEQWGKIFDFGNRRAVSDSDRFNANQAPSAYNFGNPEGLLGYNGNYVFYYPGLSLHESPPAPDFCSVLPFSCYLREGMGPLNYEQMIESVFPGPGAFIEFGGGWPQGANGATLGGFGFSAFGGTPVTVAVPRGAAVRFENIDSLIQFFEEEPAGTYQLFGNGGDETSPIGDGMRFEYKHDPEAAHWRKKLMESMSPTGFEIPGSPELPAVPAVPATAQNPIDIEISGIVR